MQRVRKASASASASASAESSASANASASASAESSASSSALAESSADIVYVSCTGARWHALPRCGNMKSSKAMSRGEAESKGLTRCGNCGL